MFSNSFSWRKFATYRASGLLVCIAAAAAAYSTAACNDGILATPPSKGDKGANQAAPTQKVDLQKTADTPEKKASQAETPQQIQAELEDLRTRAFALGEKLTIAYQKFSEESAACTDGADSATKANAARQSTNQLVALGAKVLTGVLGSSCSSFGINASTLSSVSQGQPQAQGTQKPPAKSFFLAENDNRGAGAALTATAGAAAGGSNCSIGSALGTNAYVNGQTLAQASSLIQGINDYINVAKSIPRPGGCLAEGNLGRELAAVKLEGQILETSAAGLMTLMNVSP